MTDAELDRMEQMWAEGVPTKLIAEELGYVEGTVRHNARRHRDRFPYRRPSVNEGMKRLWVARVLAKRCTIGAAARELGVTYSAVYNWVRDARDREVSQ